MFTRRAALRGATAVAAMSAVPATAIAAAHIDGPLLALEQEWHRKLHYACIEQPGDHEGETLRTARGSYNTDLGNYYIINLHSNYLVAGNCDPEELGKELGVLAEWESLAGE